MTLNCLLVDDEPIALNVLEDHIKKLPDLRLCGRCSNAMEAFSALQSNAVDILFIDIEMPGITGIEFIRSLKNLPIIVLTTAYPEFAVQGFELDVADYLLKPIAFDRFLKTIDKVLKKSAFGTIATEPQKTTENSFFFVKSNLDHIKLEYEKVLFIEGLENYVKIHCYDKSIIAFSTMKNMEDLLARRGFLRIHRSFIINLSKIEIVRNSTIKINGRELSIGSSYKKTVLQVLKKHFSLDK